MLDVSQTRLRLGPPVQGPAGTGRDDFYQTHGIRGVSQKTRSEVLFHSPTAAIKADKKMRKSLRCKFLLHCNDA